MTPERAQQILDDALRDGSLPQGFLKVLAVGVARSGKTISKKHIFGMEYDPNFSVSTGVCEAPIHAIRSFCCELINLDALSLLTTEALNEVLAYKLRQGFLRGYVAETAENILKAATSFSSSSGGASCDVPTPSGDSAASKAVVTAVCDASSARAEAKAKAKQHGEWLPDEEELFKLQVVLFSGKRTVFMVIGTHKDLIHECDETLEEKNERLAYLLLPDLEEVLIMNGNSIIFAVNAKHPNENDEKCFDLIRGHISDLSVALELLTPISFLMFQIDLIKYGKEYKKRVVSMEECQVIGGRLKMDRQCLEAALIHFNKLSMFLYLPSVLPGRVFIDPQMPLDSVNRIVAYSYQVGCGAIVGLTPSESQQWKEGVVTSETLKGDMFSSYFIRGLFEAEDALKFFYSIYIVAPLSNAKFIMPAILQTVSEEDIKQHLPAPSEHVAPLLLHFHKSSIANGMFCSTHTCIRSVYGWTTSYVIKQGRSVPACLFRNAVELQHPSKAITITLVNTLKHFEVYLDSPQADLLSICPEIRDMLLDAVDRAATALQLTYSEANVAFQCPCSPGIVHTAIPNEAHSNLKCTMTNKVIRGELTAAQKVWLGANPAASKS